MANCQKCGTSVDENDLYEDQGLKVCEECKIKGAHSPAIPCNGEK